MAAEIKEGDRVRVADRDATAEDMKTGSYMNHYRGLTGTVQKLFPTNEAAIDVDQTSLTESIAARHLEIQEQMKNKWLDGLSEDARTKLTPQERAFKLRYTILVSLKDIQAA